MPIYAVQAILGHDNALPKDATVNTWHFDATSLADLDPAIDALLAFYNAIDVALSSTFSGVITFKAYNLADPLPRVPVLISTSALTVGGTAGPAQVALVLSFQRAVVSGENQARRRNRVFLGPWTPAQTDSATGRPLGTLLTAVADAADVLLASSLAAAEWTWVCWSPTDAEAGAVDNGWVDNRWDTQRRRLPSVTDRTLFA